MFHFIVPFSDGTAWHVMLGGRDTADAVDQYIRLYWNPGTTGAVGVWHNSCLAGRILPVFNIKTECNDPLFQSWP
jgi:hypothetical protein